MGVGMAKQDSKMLRAATDQLATIAGQQPSVRRARKSIAAFKLREGMPVGVAVTLRGERGYEFLDRLISIAIPRIRDFRGLSPRSFDGRGNYSLGVREQIIFPEIDYDAIDQVRGLDITITTSAATDLEAYALLAALGMPFSAQGRPKGFDPEAARHAERTGHAPPRPPRRPRAGRRPRPRQSPRPRQGRAPPRRPRRGRARGRGAAERPLSRGAEPRQQPEPPSAEAQPSRASPEAAAEAAPRDRGQRAEPGQRPRTSEPSEPSGRGRPTEHTRRASD